MLFILIKGLTCNWQQIQPVRSIFWPDAAELLQTRLSANPIMLMKPVFLTRRLSDVETSASFYIETCPNIIKKLMKDEVVAGRGCYVLAFYAKGI